MNATGARFFTYQSPLAAGAAGVGTFLTGRFQRQTEHHTYGCLLFQVLLELLEGKAFTLPTGQDSQRVCVPLLRIGNGEPDAFLTPVDGEQPAGGRKCYSRVRHARLPLLHRREEFFVRLRSLHALQEELDGLHRRHISQEIAQQIGLVELLLIEE